MRSVGIYLLCFSALVWAQGPLAIRLKSAPAADVSAPEPTLRSDAHWVRIPVIATNGFGASETGLALGDFEVLEDGVVQEPRHLGFEEGPVSVGIVFDASSSMDKKIADSRTALRQLFYDALPEDEYSLVQFSDEPKLLSGFTSSSAFIERAVDRINPERATALFDAVLFASQKMRGAKNTRKALFILSDGADNNSRYSEAELGRYVRESDVAIYSIAIRSSSHHAGTLRKMSEATGGLSIEVRDMNDLGPAVAHLNRVLRSHYVLGYVSNQSTRQGDGRYRRVEIKLTAAAAARRELHLNWRRGYFPAESF